MEEQTNTANILQGVKAAFSLTKWTTYQK